MSSLFKTLEYEAFRAGITPRTEQSRQWFRQRVQNLRSGRINRNQLMKEDPVEVKSTQVLGNMYMFYYDPKHKETLPYYDRFPLAIVIGPAEGGFLGLNLHYLPPVLRAKFLDSLLDTMNNQRYDQSTKFKVTYELLKRASKLRYFKPCIKHYLSEHVKSRFGLVPAPEWEIATFLPTAVWEKSTANKVYQQSRNMI